MCQGQRLRVRPAALLSTGRSSGLCPGGWPVWEEEQNLVSERICFPNASWQLLAVGPRGAPALRSLRRHRESQLRAAPACSGKSLPCEAGIPTAGIRLHSENIQQTGSPSHHSGIPRSGPASPSKTPQVLPRHLVRASSAHAAAFLRWRGRPGRSWDWFMPSQRLGILASQSSAAPG